MMLKKEKYKNKIIKFFAGYDKNNKKFVNAFWDNNKKSNPYGWGNIKVTGDTKKEALEYAKKIIDKQRVR